MHKVEVGISVSVADVYYFQWIAYEEKHVKDYYSMLGLTFLHTLTSFISPVLLQPNSCLLSVTIIFKFNLAL